MNISKPKQKVLGDPLNPVPNSNSLELQTMAQSEDSTFMDSPKGNTSLLPRRQRGQTETFMDKLYDFFGVYRNVDHRTLNLNGRQTSSRHVPNLVKNQKYNVLTIIPIVLYNQFKYFFNMFYLLIAVSQFVPSLKVGYMFTYIGPLALVLILTLVKEGSDDYKRYKRDKEANSTKYQVLKPGGSKVWATSGDLRVGDIVEVTPAHRIPADMILLYSTEKGGSTFIKTDQLDGETDWKLRRSVRHTQEFFSQEECDINQLEGCTVSLNGPSENIYAFEGVYRSELSNVSEPLFLDHTLWTDTKITSGKAYGLVIYTGKETRIVMNSREPRSKAGKLELELNYLSKILFVLMLLIAIVIMVLKGFHEGWYILYFRYVLLICSIIPISLRVNLDFAKVVFSGKINNDSNIPGTITRNSTIPEELGRITYLLTDKTGTLTKNEMYFKRLVLEHTQYEPENLGQMAKMIKNSYEKSQNNKAPSAQNTAAKPTADNILQQMTKAPMKKDKESLLRECATAISVCHNVTPIIENGERKFHASSPDEIALVGFAQDIKMKLLDRDNDNIFIENPTGQKECFHVLANFPFSSETKRMGILLRNEITQRITFYLKGADMVICPRVKEVYRGFILDECEALARTGLRTMVFAQKHYDEEEYMKWKAVWDEANLSLVNRDEKMRAAANLLEVNMDFVGITGVEDLLQDDINPSSAKKNSYQLDINIDDIFCSQEVNVTIESLRNAGLKIWMLTGDKVETAKCIAISTGLKGIHDDIFEIKEVSNDLELSNKLNIFSNKYNTVLLIDGASLTRALETCRQLFFQSAVKAPAVICCRCLPTQKAVITEMVKQYSQQRVACIGDGGNDVGMIQASDVGIGLVGKEGQQASLASDFSITEFKHLKTLILWHGRLYYKNSAKMSQFVIHRGLIISFIQAIFTLFFYYAAISIYNGMLYVGYTSIYTMFPVFALIYDEDIDKKDAFNYPILYKTLQKSRELNMKTFLVWVWKSLFQAVVIMAMAVYLFPDTYLRIVTITFTALILSEILNVYTELHKVQLATVVALVGTAVVYFLSIIFFKTYIDVDAINMDFMKSIGIIVAASWLPLHILKLILKRYDPTDFEKITRKI